MPQPCVNCVIELRGSFELSWADYVHNVLVYEQIVEGSVRSTTLVWHPIDLEAFLGTLQMLVDRGFPVLEFEYRQALPGAAMSRNSLLIDTTNATPELVRCDG